MVLDVLLLLAGLTLLVAGAEGLVGSASALALRAQVPTAVVGLTVVGWGTSLPELVVSLDATAAGQFDVAVGNVVGSNLYNITLILGVSALLSPLRVARQTLQVDTPVMVLSAMVLLGFSLDGVLGPLEGSLLLVGLLAHTAVLYSVQNATASTEPLPTTGWMRWGVGGLLLLVVTALALMGVGSRLLLDGAMGLALAVGISERVVGLTLVGVGTSLPEFFASVVATLRGKHDIAISNIVGSNIFNAAGILGVAALVAPLSIHPHISGGDMLWMVGLSGVLLALMFLGRGRLGRLSGVVLLVLAVVYTATLGG